MFIKYCVCYYNTAVMVMARFVEQTARAIVVERERGCLEGTYSNVGTETLRCISETNSRALEMILGHEVCDSSAFAHCINEYINNATLLDHAGDTKKTHSESCYTHYLQIKDLKCIKDLGLTQAVAKKLLMSYRIANIIVINAFPPSTYDISEMSALKEVENAKDTLIRACDDGVCDEIFQCVHDHIHKLNVLIGIRRLPYKYC